ncbi:hypothetical protein CAEBREN_19901 [Caenorhabditis brenneri]|uniref:Sdz-33 F-box domain-containing protein n=1 Tax=Caenorhabditis brenneri TaxID=135651 RepID=G0MMH8_CAEBE|nr:hypothetical protein CAEBREN_19901 [Caenorhabditis brenneri]
MPLPLLRIPDVALRYITIHMRKVELVIISLCSRRADRALKRCGQKELSYFDIEFRNFFNLLEHFKLSLIEAGRAEGGVCTTQQLKLTVIISDVVRVFVNFNGYTFYSFHVVRLNKLDQISGEQKRLMIKGTSIPVVLAENDEMYTFWNKRSDGLIFLLKCLNEKFEDATHKVEVRNKPKPNALKVLRKLVDYTSLSEVSLTDFCFDFGVQMPMKDFKYILKKIKFRDHLVRKCTFTSWFEADKNFKFHGTIPCSDLIIYSWGYWLTLKHLLECKHREIVVADSKLTNEDIKTYMNRWVTGAIPDVQEVHVQMYPPFFNVKHVLSGLKRCRMSDGVQRDNILDNLCVFIKGAGEKIARVGMHKRDHFKMKVYSDPDAVEIEDEESEEERRFHNRYSPSLWEAVKVYEESNKSEDIDEDEEEDVEDDEDEDEEESDENMKEGGEDDDNDQD